MWTKKFILPAEKEKRWMINATNATMQRIDWTCEYLWMCLLATGNQHVALFYAIGDLWTLTNGSWWLISSILNKYLTFFSKKNLNKSSCQPSICINLNMKQLLPVSHNCIQINFLLPVFKNDHQVLKRANLTKSHILPVHFRSGAFTSGFQKWPPSFETHKFDKKSHTSGSLPVWSIYFRFSKIAA